MSLNVLYEQFLDENVFDAVQVRNPCPLIPPARRCQADISVLLLLPAPGELKAVCVSSFPSASSLPIKP